MQLTKHTDYAFRVLIYLAGMHEERTTIQAITEKFGVSKTHLMKVVNELANKGWIDSVRGKNGGISLGALPESISLREILEHMEKTLEPVNCSTPECYINNICQLKPILMQAQEQYLEHMGQYTLADLVDPKIIARISA